MKLFLHLTLCIGIMVRVFANGPGDLGSIPGRVIPKTQKMVLDAILLNTQHYKVLSRVKWSNLGKRVMPSPTPWCSSYRKGILQVTLDYGRQLYLLYCPVGWGFRIHLLHLYRGVRPHQRVSWIWHEFKSWTRLIAFHIALIPLGKVWIQLFSLQLWLNSRRD